MEEPVWREMRDADLAGVETLGNRIHPGLTERPEVFADRLALFPQGCQVLATATTIEGYAISHPARLFDPPPLDTVLGRLPDDADGYYIHDVVVAPHLRGAGHARIGVYHALDAGAAFRETALIAVYGTMPFWQRFGFADRTGGIRPEKLAPYGPEARYMVRRKSAVEFTPRAG
ncbi:N-acetyltransferase [Aureimonas endophytica]|uniref:N-acetyltransferase n=1 Tax=Aureimonas endophytica TaxID=2027858 RepID=A0A916ZHK7_9HYPH|nr:GNAT family N-acetyltransferase [Aureimonas endophytica]GGD97003.1 N-acetyltransferase [Aureimonas endophytica]